VAADKEANLVWIDLEMTGLCPEQNRVLEIASLVTDAQLNIVAEGPSLVIHYPLNCLQNMNEWVRTTHTKSGLLASVSASTISLAQAEQTTLDFLVQHCAAGKSPLCGNSIWQDRSFLRLHMPRIHDFLNYRMIDVSSFKEIIKRWYPDNPQAIYTKKDSHRAHDDIIESIEELKHYKNNFFIF
jgi:oligoribonuclease